MQAKTEIDVKGQAITPGFINMLAHPEETLFADGRALSDLTQGVTLEVMGEMSMGPLEQSRPWETRAVVGMYRFLQRVWRNLVDEETGEIRVVDEAADDETRRLLHRTIAAVSSAHRDSSTADAAAHAIVTGSPPRRRGSRAARCPPGTPAVPADR